MSVLFILQDVPEFKFLMRLLHNDHKTECPLNELKREH